MAAGTHRSRLGWLGPAIVGVGILGSLAGTWDGKQFAATLEAHSAVGESSTAPPLAISLEASGDFTNATIKRALVSMDKVQFRIAEPVRIDYQGHML